MRIVRQVKLRLFVLIVATTVCPALAGAAFKDEIPTVAQLRSEVQANPRVTPPSLLKFASLVREKQEEAARSEPMAQALLPELKKCVLDRGIDTVNSARAYCLSGALALGARFASIKPLADEIRDQASPDIVRLLPD
jgi:hypothetical protein